MAEQKTNDKKMDHVRKILDNPYQNVSLYNKYESTLRARLIGQQRYQPQPIQKTTSNHDLKPLVVIHREQEEKPQIKETPIKEIEEQEPIQEQSTYEESYYSDEDLFEIEPDSISETEIPIFIEVKQKDQNETKQPEQELSEPEIEQENIQNLPKWEAVVESEKAQEIIDEEKTIPAPQIEKAPESKEIIEEQPQDDFKEVKEEIDIDKTLIWQTVDKTKEKKPAKPKKKLLQKSPTEEKKKKPRRKSKFFSSHKKELEKELEDELEEEIDKKEPVEKPKVEEKSEDKSSFSFKEYNLYEKEIDLGRGKTRTIRFFSKDVPDDSIPTSLPENYEVKINKKTGVPYLRKKQK